jgi:predicted nucleic acid-binding protein
LLIDSSVVLAYLAGSEGSSLDAVDLFDGAIATGRNPASISAITVAEILVRPYRSGTAAVATIEGFLAHLDVMRIVAIDADVARQAARIRAATNLPMPDAVIVASAVITNADVIVTSDRTWRRRLAASIGEIEIVEIAAS